MITPSAKKVFSTASSFPEDDIHLLRIEDIILIKVFEIIFSLKDLLSNNDNYGWLSESKKILVIDFSINKDELMKAIPAAIVAVLNEKLKDNKRYQLQVLNSSFNKGDRTVKESTVRHATELLVDSFIADIDSTNESINGFIRTYPYGFEGGYEKASAKLEKYIDLIETRWTEILTYLKLNK